MQDQDHENDIAQRITDLMKSNKWLNIKSALDLLVEHTGENKAFDPYRDTGQLLWSYIGQGFINNKQFMEALTVYQTQLKTYYDIQEETERRIHKGAPYHLTGTVYLKIGKLETAREHFLLALVEDILTEIQSNREIEGLPNFDDAFQQAASIVLELTFRMRKSELEDLNNFTREQITKNPDEKCFFPELIVLEWRNSRVKYQQNNITLTRAVEETLFHINNHIVRNLLDKTESDTTGMIMEELATYIFSCVDGFEPIPKQQTDAFQFDVVVRNLTQGHPLLNMLGEYIGVEAKNINKTVSVAMINHFIHKLRLHNMKCGIIFTDKGISGMKFENGLRYGKNIQVKTFNRDNLIVFDLTKDDLERVIQGDNLISILLQKYEEILYK